MASTPPDKGSTRRPPSPPPDNSSSAAISNDFTVDLALEDDTLTALDKIYLFTTSKAPFHRIFITHSLHEYLNHVPPHDAIQYVLPLISGLAMDSDEQVKEALAAELEKLIWWFFTNCQVVPGSAQTPIEEDMINTETVEISVQSFTPILGTLLLSSNPLVGGAARHAIVDLLNRLKQADEDELNLDRHQGPHSTGLFGMKERDCFRTEIFQQIVIGMARLDFDSDDRYEQVSLSDETFSPDYLIPSNLTSGQLPSPNKELPANRQHSENINPYFPVDPASYHNDLLRPKSPKSAQSPKAPFSPLDNINGALSHMTNAPPSNHSSDLSGFTSEPRTKSPDSQVPRSPTEEKLANWPPAPQTDPVSQVGLRHEPEVADIPLEIVDEHAAAGRLASMSLMAVVAAGGYLDYETQKAFVEEVERVGQDPIYWVRREASFALGALSKVVPEELIICSLLPLFEKLRLDASWHVRHSSLFALPAILTRLPHPRRRALALETLLKLAGDESKLVRSGVLESLGEVLLTFSNDEEGPPDKLLRMFLGRREDKRLRDGQQFDPAQVHTSAESLVLESFYSDVDRPLICAFNFPAVALTLGKERWQEIRDVYLDLASQKNTKVQRTLAASLGELAKIIGPENARRDLLELWRTNVRCKEEEVRLKVIEAAPLLAQVLASEGGDDVVKGLASVWDEGVLTNWRERKYTATSLVDLMVAVTSQAYTAVVDLLKRALEDGVASVRESAVYALPWIWKHMSGIQGALLQLKAGLRELANSDIARRRATFVACQQALVKFEQAGYPIIQIDGDFWSAVSTLADDAIVDVRIGVARLMNVVVNDRGSQVVTPGPLLDVINRLAHDRSRDVQSFVSNLAGIWSRTRCNSGQRSLQHIYVESFTEYSTFSRPPPFQDEPRPEINSDQGMKSESDDEHNVKQRPGFRITISSSSISVAKSSESRTATITDDPGEGGGAANDYNLEVGVNLKASIPMRA